MLSDGANIIKTRVGVPASQIKNPGMSLGKGTHLPWYCFHGGYVQVDELIFLFCARGARHKDSCGVEY